MHQEMLGDEARKSDERSDFAEGSYEFVREIEVASRGSTYSGLGDEVVPMVSVFPK
jgi:hypothetical protein